MVARLNDPSHRSVVERLIGTYTKSSQAMRATPPTPGKEMDINQEVARREKIKNDDAEQDIRLKKQTLNRLFLFLATETALIFLFTFAQATYLPAKFHLEEWSFKLLVGATLAQITGMVFVAVRYLFPKRP
jgi:hypothetical protein